MIEQYEKLMRRCLELARKSEGRVSPNPLVGAVIFDDEFNIISEGRHEYYGGNHAERNAILSTEVDLKGKSIIVNLEPCSHYGKTPPCADLIIEKGFKRVISGMVDPNPIVAGRGLQRLRDAGIEVIEGILEDECKYINRKFIKNHVEKMPYVTIKTATTLDGKIATSVGSSKWITDDVSREEVQKLRNEYDAILTSSNTVVVDNPSLTCRMDGGRNPVRIILDSNLVTLPSSKVYIEDGTKVFIFTGEKSLDVKIKQYSSNVEIIKVPLKNGHVDIQSVLKILYDLKIRSILVEAGGRLNKVFIEENCVDELVQFVAPKILGDKNAVNFVEGFEKFNISDCNNLIFKDVKRLKNDIMIHAKFNR